jgi:hypothetical protein
MHIDQAQTVTVLVTSKAVFYRTTLYELKKSHLPLLAANQIAMSPETTHKSKGDVTRNNTQIKRRCHSKQHTNQMAMSPETTHKSKGDVTRNNTQIKRRCHPKQHTNQKAMSPEKTHKSNGDVTRNNTKINRQSIMWLTYVLLALDMYCFSTKNFLPSGFLKYVNISGF